MTTKTLDAELEGRLVARDGIEQIMDEEQVDRLAACRSALSNFASWTFPVEVYGVVVAHAVRVTTLDALHAAHREERIAVGVKSCAGCGEDTYSEDVVWQHGSPFCAGCSGEGVEE